MTRLSRAVAGGRPVVVPVSSNSAAAIIWCWSEHRRRLHGAGPGVARTALDVARPIGVQHVRLRLSGADRRLTGLCKAVIFCEKPVSAFGVMS